MSEAILEAPNINSGKAPRDVNAPRVLFLVVNEGLSSVFPAMVARPVGWLHAQGVNIDLAVVCPAGEFVRPDARRQWSSRRRELQEYFPGRMTRLPSAPSRLRRYWNDFTVFHRWLRRTYGERERLVIHCRGSAAATLANRAKRVMPNVRVLYDVRGLQEAEHLQVRGFEADGSAPATVLGESERVGEVESCAAEEADHVICVSQELADRFGMNQNKVSVVWNHLCMSDFEEAVRVRKETRASLCVGDRLVMTYCGSFEAWQPAEVCVRAFLEVREHAPEAHLLVLTKHGTALERAMAAEGLDSDDVTLKCVPHYEVGRYLAAGDFGLIPRGLGGRLHLADRVSAPVKFAEYLASGTPVIMSEGIGDYSELARRERVGLVIPTDAGVDKRAAMVREFIEDYLGSREEWRERCRVVARRELDSGVHLAKVVELYERLSS